jgi:hypothetical protein
MAPVIRGNSFYTIVDGLNWQGGENYAIKLGGHLASISSSEEDIFLKENFQRGWIGLTDSASEGTWRWTDGSQVTYTNWEVGQPDNTRGIQHYAQAWTQSGKWDDAEEDTPQQSIAFNKRSIIEIPLSYFSVSDITVTEGSSGSITISRTGGTATAQNLTLTTSNGTATSGSDYNSINTTVSFAAGETSKIIAISTTDDSSVESTETINVSLGASGADTVPAQISKGSAVVTITDNDIAPTYTLTTSTTSINEGSTLTTSITTTDVASGTTLYYSLSGTGINSSDFSSGALTGSGTVGSNGSFSFSHTLANDLTTEGTETLEIKLFSDSDRTVQVGSTASVSINDTSAAITTIINNNSFTTINNITNTTTNNNYVYINSNNTINNTWNTVLIDNSVNIRDVISQWFPTSASISQSQALTDTKFFDISASTWEDKVKINSVARSAVQGGRIDAQQVDFSADPRQGSLLSGDKSSDEIRGKAGWDVLDGGAANDFIRAGNGRDIITGGLGADELHGDFGWNTYKSEKDGASDLIAIKSDHYLVNWLYGQAGNNPNGEKADIIEGLDSIDKIKIIGVDTRDITFAANVNAKGVTGIGIYGKGALEALYTGGDLTVAQITQMTSGDASAAAMSNSIDSYGVW